MVLDVAPAVAEPAVPAIKVFLYCLIPEEKNEKKVFARWHKRK